MRPGAWFRTGLCRITVVQAQVMFLKNCLFAIFTVTVFFAGCEIILGIAGIRPALSTEDPFVGFAENIPLFVEDRQADGSMLVRTAGNKLKLFNNQTFPKHKGDNTYRVFCMGGSTTFGRPYDDKVSFCGWLRAYLNAADPARDWEIINVGGVSYASYRVAKLMGELVQYQPDLFIVYSGQNEFLEQRSYSGLIDLPAWLANLNTMLSGTRIYTALDKAIDRMKPDSRERAREHYRLSGEVDAILDHSVGPQSYHRDDVLKTRIMTHYRLNLDRMIRIARQAGARIILVKPAINIRDMSPFKSEHTPGLPEQVLADWQVLYERAQSLEKSGDDMPALAAYRQAMAIDDRYADLHYRVGRILFRLGRYGESERSLRRAVEEDIAPLRILEPMQHSLAEVAGSAGVPLVDFPAILRRAYLDRYDHAVFGKEYFVDHVHPNLEGYRLLGLALFDELVGQGIARPDATWNAACRESVRQAVITTLDTSDEGHALVKLARVLAWAGKFAEAHELFARALEVLGPRPELYDQLARSAYASGDDDSAIRHLRRLLELFPLFPGAHTKLAAVLANRGETDLAIWHGQLEIQQNPADYDTIAMLGELFERQGNDDEARRHYEQTLQLAPDLEMIRLRLACLLIRQGQFDKAQAHAREVLRDNPGQYRAHHVLGQAFMRQGDREQASYHFSEVLRMNPGDPDALEDLRQLQAGRDGTDIAAAVYPQRAALAVPVAAGTPAQVAGQLAGAPAKNQ